MAVAVRKRPITVDEFIRMGETGILKADERLELAAGDILSMPPIGPEHNTASLALTRIVTLAVGTRAWVSIAGPVRLTPHDLRYPDLTVLRDNERAYRGTLPSRCRRALLDRDRRYHARRGSRAQDPALRPRRVRNPGSSMSAVRPSRSTATLRAAPTVPFIATRGPSP